MDNYIGTINNVPSEYGIDIPSNIKSVISEYNNLPINSSDSEYLKSFKIIDDKIFFVEYPSSGSTGLYEINHEFTFIDPNSVFIIPNKRTVPFASRFYKNRGQANAEVIEKTENVDITYIPLYLDSSGHSGIYAVKDSEVTLRTSVSVIPIIKIGITSVGKTTKNYNVIYNVFNLLGIYPENNANDRVIRSSIGISEYLGSLSRYDINGGTYVFIPYITSYNGFDVRPWTSYGTTTNFLTSRYTYTQNVYLDAYYSLFNKLIFADTSGRIDYLLSLDLDDFIKEIKTDYVNDPYRDGNTSSAGGGNGSYGQGENYFDTLGLIPNGSAEANDSRGTMYTRYLVSLNEMSILGDWLWADEFGLQVAKTAISLLYGDPVQTVISCVSYPFNISNLASSSSVPFHWGGHDAGFNLSALNQNAFSIDWGTITISEYWGNFLDYSPHTQMQLYLPWGTGFVHIDPNDILKSNSSSSLTGRGTLGIKTNVDLSRGVCVHNVIANNTVIGSYSGSCGRQIPITGSDYASKQVSMAGAAIGAMVAGGVVAGSAYSQYSNLEAVPNPTGRYSGGASDGILRKQDAAGRYHDIKTGKFVSAPTPRRYDVVHGEVDKGSMTRLAANAARPAVASAASILVSPPSVSRSGSFQEGAGSLSIQQPYLIISRPKMSMPNNYGYLYGYPSNIYSYLGSLTGYTEVGAVHLDGLPATAEEISEIDSLLKGGVIL